MPEKVPRATKLSRQEIRVLSVVFMRNRQIAVLFNLQCRTVEKIVESLMKKFNVRTRTSLALKALMLGYGIDWLILDNSATGELDWLLYSDWRDGDLRRTHSWGKVQRATAHGDDNCLR